MKNKLFAIFALSALLVSCEKDKIFNENIIADRPVTALQVSYSLDGQEVKSLSFSNKAHEVVLDVAVNDANLRWTLESNRSWCKVTGEGKGSGKVVLTIDQNEDFDDRSTASLTFVAGQYRGYLLSVDQSGTVFILSQPYFISGVAGASYQAKVTTPAGMDWEIEPVEWISATKGASTSSGGYVTTTVNITVGQNSDATRFGAITLRAVGESSSVGEIFVNQFGTEYDYTPEGQILLSADEGTSLSFTVPSQVIASVEVPKYATYTVVPGENDTEIVTVELAENLSDAQQARKVPVSIKLNNSSATTVTLPEVHQDFKDAHGLMTSTGLGIFAKRVNEGGDISGWMRDGEVLMLQDIDMSDLEDTWTAIGTEAHPFDKPFNGGGHKIMNLKSAPAPVFGVLSGAKVSNLIIDSSCSFYANSSFSGNRTFSALAGSLKASELRGCKVASTINLAGAGNALAKVYFGSVAATADESSLIVNCDSEGSMVLSCTFGMSSEAYIGGIVASTLGEVSACNSAVDIELGNAASLMACGGVTSVLNEQTKVKNNTFLGSLTSTGASDNICLGGLYGQVKGTRTMDHATDMSASMGEIKISGLTNASGQVYAGSYIGYLSQEGNLTMSGYESTTKITLDCKALPKAAIAAIGGILGGTGAEASVTATALVNKGDIANPCDGAVAQNIKSTYAGGCVGLVNGNLSLTECVNNATLGLEQITAKSNGYRLVFGGIVGASLNGACSITGCTNTGVILMFPYNNNVWSNFDCNISGGIIGGYDCIKAAERESSAVAVIKNCEVTGGQWGYRGVCGGIAGFAARLDMSGCKCSGPMNGSKGPGGVNTNNHAYVGGAVGVMETGKIEDCKATLSIFAGSPGSESAQTGGIVGVVSQSATINLCSFYGDMSKSNSKADEAIGGILGVSTTNTKVSGCKMGGNIGGTKVSDLNVRDLCCGDGNATIESVSVWDGQ